jgi:hypothetical protein
MKISLFVEGSSDEDTLPKLARKVSPNVGFITRVLPRGDLLNAAKVGAYIKAITTKHQDILKVIVCPDSECTPEEEFLKIVLPIERDLRDLVKKPPVYYCGVIHATEAWLACDAVALGKYIGLGNTKAPGTQAIVNSCKPKQALREFFTRHGREFTNVRDNPRLADTLDAEVLVKVSASFARFAKLLRQQ